MKTVLKEEHYLNDPYPTLTIIFSLQLQICAHLPTLGYIASFPGYMKPHP